MNITLFGGSFNPPHLGHQILIAQAFELIPNLDQIWLLPDYKHAFSKNKFLISPPHRLAMTKTLENSKVKTESCVIEQKMSSGHTIEPVEYLIKKYPQHSLSFLLGSDNLEKFDQWGSWEKLLELIPFYIYPRVGYNFSLLRKNMFPLEHPLQTITNISSTNIRERLNRNLEVNHLISQPVKDYIKTNKLYA